mmetsp:Transcript_6103/g.11937  ORF Transcript_6103/g.11937 Transcript_6103/m.11937 type:complete len:82 (+) Transcript_6103:194-439(+)
MEIPSKPIILKPGEDMGTCIIPQHLISNLESHDLEDKVYIEDQFHGDPTEKPSEQVRLCRRHTRYTMCSGPSSWDAKCKHA